MPKNIVILCDGTSNEISSNRTNILRLFGCLEKSDKQVVFYDPGVGTFGADGAPFRFQRKSAEIWGLATGWGLDTNVKEAYRFIVDHYSHGSDDEKPRITDNIFIYGFSRGAYTARVLAGFIHAFGLIDKVNLNLLDYAYQAYKGISEKRDHEQDSSDSNAFSEIRLYQRTLRPVQPTINFLGLFDTVASVIESGRRGPRLTTHAFTSKNRSVAAVRHAVAIDERRTMFQPLLWPAGEKHRPDYWVKKTETDQDVDEQWFRGCHGDIGGGNAESASGLAKIPLEWMISQSKPFGVKFKTRTVNTIVLAKTKPQGDKVYVAPNPCAQINESMKEFWPVVEYLPRRKSIHVETNRKVWGGFFIPKKERRIIPKDATIHTSVFECDDIDPRSLHPNLPPEE